MSSFKTFGGIDFSGAREPLSNLWSVLGIEENGRLVIVDVRPHAYRLDLAGFASNGWKECADIKSGPVLWGVDFPLGLAAETTDILGGGRLWEEYIRWVADRPPDEVKEAAGGTLKAGRIADAGAMAPLDIRLYKQTVEGIRWIYGIREETEISVVPQFTADAECCFIEVYPSASVRDLGLPRRRTPGRSGEIRARTAALKPYLEFADPRLAALAVTLEDAWDATIACLTAYLCRDDLSQPDRLAPSRLEQIRREGWIYRAPAALT